MNNFSQSSVRTYDMAMREYLLFVFKQMFVALLITGFAALFVASSHGLQMAIFGSPLRYVVIFAPIGIAVYMQVRLYKISPSTATILLYSFAALMGMSMASLLIMYTGESVCSAFFIAASVFGAAVIYGNATKKDLSGMGSIMIMMIIGLFIASLVNMFMNSTGLQYAISCISVVVFTCLTAYDMQKMKDLYNTMNSSGDFDSKMQHKIAIYGALTLYLDFINIFISLVNIMGNRRD